MFVGLGFQVFENVQYLCNFVAGNFNSKPTGDMALVYGMRGIGIAVPLMTVGIIVAWKISGRRDLVFTLTPYSDPCYPEPGRVFNLNPR